VVGGVVVVVVVVVVERGVAVVVVATIVVVDAAAEVVPFSGAVEVVVTSGVASGIDSASFPLPLEAPAAMSVAPTASHTARLTLRSAIVAAQHGTETQNRSSHHPIRRPRCHANWFRCSLAAHIGDPNETRFGGGGREDCLCGTASSLMS